MPLARAAVVTRLRAAGCVFAEEEAALLLDAGQGDAATLARLVAARCAGRPLETLLGRAELGGLTVAITPGVFVPRQRSLLLVEEAARTAPRGATVVDLCCGSGALLVVLLARRPDLRGHAADLDPAAVACARANLASLSVVHQGDLFEALPSDLRGRVDVLVVNAPYVPTAALATMPPEARDHEPRLALDGGDDGLDVHRRVLVDAGAWLAPGGRLIAEVAPAQVETYLGLLAAAALTGTVVEDAERAATAVVVQSG